MRKLMIGSLLHVILIALLIGQLSIPPLGQATSQSAQDSKGTPFRGPRTGAGPAQSDLASKKVLILHSFGHAQPAYVIMDSILAKEFVSAGIDFTSIYFEFMDLARNPEPAYLDKFVVILEEKIRRNKIDLILALHTESFQFLVGKAKSLFPGIPIISILGPPKFEHSDPTRPIVILPSSIDILSTVEAIVKLQPDIRKLVVISGSSVLDRRFEGRVRGELQDRKIAPEVEYIGDLPMDDFLKRISALPPKTAVLYTTISADRTGKTYAPAHAARMISAAANAPVYGLASTLVGEYGVVGGTVLDYRAEAQKAARLAVEILRGKLPSKPLTILPATVVPMYDWPQLKRWGLNESDLPAGTLVLNKPTPVWERYKLYIIAGVVLALSETSLIFFLLVQRRLRRRTEESLRKTEEKYRGIFEGAVEGIFETSPQGNPLTANPAMAMILGYDSADEYVSVVQDSAHQLFADPDKRAEYVALLEKHGVVLGFECELLRRDGTKIWVSIKSRRVPGPDGKTLYYSGFLEDITERKKAEEELKKKQERLEEMVEELRGYQEHLEEMVKERTAELVMAMDRAEAANRAKSAFLANMSHELRTPLNSILGIAQVMERDLEFPPKQRELLEIVSRSGHQLFELIDDILEMSRIEASLTTTIIKTFDLHRFLDDLKEMMRLRAEKKGLQLILERDSTLPNYIQTDERKLRQILLNLLGNAIKFTEKGSVILRANSKDGKDKVPENEPASPVRLEFEVEDTGVGIAPEDMGRIFEPFVQLDPAQKTSRGIGLGLAICRNFAAVLGGEITVCSQVGRGSTFKLDIGVQPVGGSDIPAREVSRQVVGLAPGQPDYRLLVVDDHLESRVLLRQLLEPVGFRVLEAASGLEAIDLYQKDQPHLVWMDIRMPGMDGYEAARRIREAEKERRKEDSQEIHTPIIALTAGVMENKEPSPLARVFDDWVYKPFREAEVFGKLEKHLRVQFVYQPAGFPAVQQEASKDRAALTPADLSDLPADWIGEFSRMLKMGRSKQLLALIDRVHPGHAKVAALLGDMVRTHNFERLIPLFEEANKGNADGQSPKHHG